MKSDQQTHETDFTLNKKNIIKGSRRLVREKSLQILVAYFISGTDIELLIGHINNRMFIIENDENQDKKLDFNDDVRLLSEEELININSDTMISWREEDKKFGRNIIYSVINNFDSFVNYIKDASNNWEFERISIIDRTIIIMAIAELIFASDVPVKVSMNEAIELAKTYSTDKSPIFVNGVLEKIKFILENKNLINKTERGLK